MHRILRESLRARPLAIVSALLLSFGVVCHAQEATESGNSTDIYVEYAQDPDTVIVEYNRNVGIEDEDDQPLLRVYGDGRVHVHYPVYMRKAGDYELYLGEEALSDLIAFMIEKGFMSFDDSGVRAQVRQAKQAQVQSALTAGAVDSGRSDSTITTIGLKLSEFRASSDKANVPQDLHKVVSWPDIELQAKDMPQVTALTDLAEVDGRLQNLLNHPELNRIDD